MKPRFRNYYIAFTKSGRRVMFYSPYDDYQPGDSVILAGDNSIWHVTIEYAFKSRYTMYIFQRYEDFNIANTPACIIPL